VHLIPLNKKEEKDENLALIFAYRIWKISSIWGNIVSDPASQFILRFWKAFLISIFVRPRMSIVFHPEIDSQTKKFNQMIEAFL
jgi:hypothetical protein